MSVTFEKQIRALVEPVQHTLSERSRQLLSDVRRLRILLLCATALGKLSLVSAPLLFTYSR